MASLFATLNIKKADGLETILPVGLDGLLPCTHTKSGTTHTFSSSILFNGVNTTYQIRAKATANFISGDTITITDGTTFYSGIALKNQTGGVADTNEFVGGTMVSLTINLAISPHLAFNA